MATRTTRKTSTTTRKTTARSAKSTKTTAAAKASATAPKPAAATKPTVAAPVPKVVKVSEPVAAQADLKKKELIDEVVIRSGVKKKDAKPVVEALLDVLGGALADGRELNLQPLGKVRINRAEEHAGYRIIVCKLRQQTGAKKDGPDPLADAAE